MKDLATFIHLKHLGISLSPSYSDPVHNEELIESCANWVREKRLQTPAILFLEMHRPLRSLAHGAALLSAPLVCALFGTVRVKEVLSFLEEEANVEKLITLLEQ